MRLPLTLGGVSLPAVAMLALGAAVTAAGAAPATFATTRSGFPRLLDVVLLGLGEAVLVGYGGALALAGLGLIVLRWAR